MNKHIFLSYRSSEADFALRLAANLKNAGVNLWMDRMDIKPGDDWIDALQNAVNECAAVIAVLSPDYATSKYCRLELARAVRMDLPIFPVLLRPVPAPDWPLEIERSQYIDFSGWQAEDAYHKQLEALVAILREKFSEQVSTVPDAETRYLTSLIADLEARKGVLEYVELAARTEDPAQPDIIRPKPRTAETWGVNVAVSVLNSQPKAKRMDDEDLTAKLSRMPLGGISEVVAQYPRFVLTGPPGVGKTTTIQRLVLDAAHARLADRQTAPIPLLIYLASWKDATTPVQLIRSQWPLHSDPLRLLTQGKILLYLDGLNEMGAAGVEKAGLLRDWLHGDYAPQRMIVTCQSGEYGAAGSRSGALNLGLPTAMAEEMDEPRIRRFAANYLGVQAASGLLARVLPENDEDLEDARHLFQLARNPFLLTILILVYANSPDGDLPRNMGALFKRLVQALWERERVRQTPGWIAFEAMETAFSRLAYAMIDEDMPIYVPREYALQHLGDEGLLRAGCSANIIGTQGDNVYFFHQLIQDYLAAVGLWHMGLATKLMRSQFDGRGIRLARKWDPVIIALSGIVANPDAVVQDIAEVDAYLALECIASGIHITDVNRRETIERLKHLMVADDNDGRVAAAKVLAAIGDPQAAELLLDTMRQGKWDIRQAAAWTLREVKIPVLSGLLEALHDWDQDIREATATAVRQIGVVAVPMLLEVLHDEHWSMRRGAAWALGEIGDRAAIPGLVEALHDEDGLVRREAAQALGWIKDADAIPGLLEALHDKDWRVRKAAAETLGWIGQPALSGLVNALRDTSINVRRVAAEALGRIGDAAAVPALLDLLRDDNADVRGAVIEALSWIRDSSAALGLIDCLADTTKLKYEDRIICNLAAEALENIGTPEALAAVEWWRQGKPLPHLQAGIGDNAVISRFIDSLRDEDSLVRWAAVKALGTFKDVAAIQGLLQALHDREVLVTDAASEALTRIGSPAVPGLLESLRDGSPNVRGAAIEALGKIKDPTAVLSLIDCLEDEAKPWLADERICNMAVKALEKIGTPEAQAAAHDWRRKHTPASVPGTPEQIAVFQRTILPELLEALHDNNWSVRRDAAKSLREQTKTMKGRATASIVKTLCESLLDEEWFVRWAVAEALAWIGDPAAIPALVPLLRDENWMVSVAVARAMAEIRDANGVVGLVDALKDERPQVREVVAEVLGVISSVTAVGGLRAALRDMETFVRRASAEALGEIGEPVAVPDLVLLLDDPDDDVRWAVVEALGKIGDVQAVEGLIGRLNDSAGPHWEEKHICDVAADALQKIGTPEALRAVEHWMGQRATT